MYKNPGIVIDVGSRHNLVIIAKVSAMVKGVVPAVANTSAQMSLLLSSRVGFTLESRYYYFRFVHKNILGIVISLKN